VVRSGACWPSPFRCSPACRWPASSASPCIGGSVAESGGQRSRSQSAPWLPACSASTRRIWRASRSITAPHRGRDRARLALDLVRSAARAPSSARRSGRPRSSASSR
jgi:hypothetical protein